MGALNMDHCLIATNSTSANTITIGSGKTLAITNATAGNIFSMDSPPGGTAKLTIGGAIGDGYKRHAEQPSALRPIGQRARHHDAPFRNERGRR